MHIEELRQQRIRLAVLRLLAGQTGWLENDEVIQAALRSYGYVLSLDQVRTELAWLEEQSLVNLDREVGRMWVARLLRRGQEAAEGIAQVPGVKRPGPEDR